MNPSPRPIVAIVGAGFGGLAAARSLAASPVDVVLIDRRNHHLFQPLLYQVATASLSPADISAPIRTILRKQRNCRVLLGTATKIEPEHRNLMTTAGDIHYDHLIVAAGATHSYFGHDDWARLAPGLKTLEDATLMRRRILMAFEMAEQADSQANRVAALTFAIIGGGPTGVELAGAIKEIAGRTIPRDYRNIDTRSTRVILFEARNRILPQFPPDLSERARLGLEKLGVEVRLNQPVQKITDRGIVVDDQFMAVRNVLWAAGVQGSPLAGSLNAPMDSAGRIKVEPDLTVPGHPEIFVIGDLAAVSQGPGQTIVPGIAPAAIQMGHYVAKVIHQSIAARSGDPPRKPFAYRDKGAMAVIGRASAVARIGRRHFSGVPAWLLWGGVHIAFLIGFRNRLYVLIHWFWNWLLNSRDARLITGQDPDDPDSRPEPQPAEQATIDSSSGRRIEN
ncbi:MAG: NAD(P)/FAD-dependent oxidoreductase [Phycisphaeraceae bacterium]|nr:NAD(P)/FAD-dependent oxidoreductase [Phycisphaeraceae bacterium]